MDNLVPGNPCSPTKPDGRDDVEDKLRDGKPKYLADTPRFIQYLRSTSVRYRELTPLLRLLDKVENIQAVTGYAFGRV